MDRWNSFFYSFKTRVTMTLILAMVFVVILNNFLVYRFNLSTHFEQLRNDLLIIAKTAALAVDGEEIERIPLTWDGARTMEYRVTSEKLKKIRDANNPLKYIYILTKTKVPGRLRFVVDTELPSGQRQEVKSAAKPGDRYDARKFPEMMEAFTAPSADRQLQRDDWGLTLSGYAPIFDKNGRSVAILGVDIMADDVYRLQQKVKQRIILVLIAGLLFCFVLGLLISGSVSDPVRRLAEGTRQLAGDNLDYRVQVRSRDEIGELADSFNKMAANLLESRQRLRNYFFKVTHSLVRALEAKDTYTQGHSERVAGLARRTALAMGMSSEKAELIHCIAELHDIGKLMISESILNKTDTLTAEEWKILQEHPVTGERILQHILDEDLLHVIRSHHERVDGKGYPDGLKGDEINLSSQIVSIADAYDAMTSARTYRAPMSREAALKELQRSSGVQFRPEVVKAFSNMMSGPV